MSKSIKFINFINGSLDLPNNFNAIIFQSKTQFF